jgi:SAM-dependent methyltransferase
MISAMGLFGHISRYGKRLVRPMVPRAVHQWVWDRRLASKYFCPLRRVEPIRRDFGWQSGQTISRYYIEKFLIRHASDIHGHVLEIGDRRYTSQFGGNRVHRSDVLHVMPGNPDATIIADLTRADHIPSQSFDCIILIHTLQYIYDTKSAIRTLYRVLKPGGVVLAAFPGISQIARHDMDHWGDYWRFTTLSARKLFTAVFAEDGVNVQAYGNVLAAVAFLHGLIAKELTRQELDDHDVDYEVLITVKAIRHKEDNPGSLRC